MTEMDLRPLLVSGVLGDAAAAASSDFLAPLSWRGGVGGMMGGAATGAVPGMMRFPLGFFHAHIL